MVDRTQFSKQDKHLVLVLKKVNRKDLMKILPLKPQLPIFLIMLLQFVSAQNNQGHFLRSTMGSSGSFILVETSKGDLILSQSIGQNSVIGTYANKGFILLQGYQQPFQNSTIEPIEDRSLKVTVFPNPFREDIRLVIQETSKTPVEVSIWDIHGRSIFKRKYNPVSILEIPLANLASGTYMILVQKEARMFRAKLIKH